MLSGEDLAVVTKWCREVLPTDRSYAIMQNGTVFLTDGETTDVQLDDSWLKECEQFGKIPALADISLANRGYLAEYFPQQKPIRRTVIAQSLAMMKRYGYPIPGRDASDRNIAKISDCWLSTWQTMDGVVTVFPEALASNAEAAIDLAGELTRWDFTVPRYHYIRGKK